MRKAVKELVEKCRFSLSDKEADIYADELTRYFLSDDINDKVEL